jgi:hypothetical protein
MLQAHLDRRQRRQKGRRAPLAPLLALCVGAGVGMGCEEYGPRVYTAAPYRAALGCLDPYVPIGLVQARDLGSLCEPICLREGDTLYASRVCAPYPTEATIEAADAGGCAAAVEALTAEAFCTDPAADAGAP